MQEVAANWRRIRSWYEKNGKSLALPEGAGSAAIKERESALKLKLPADLKKSYLLHNGSQERGVFPYAYYLLSTSEIIREWLSWRDGVESGQFDRLNPSPRGSMKKWWNPKWIPFTANGSGDHDCVDMDPTKRGKVGQVIRFSHETGPGYVAAESLGAWLNAFADALEDGNFRYDEYSLTLLPASEA
jgi:cell wall assembly regulator SMI1